MYILLYGIIIMITTFFFSQEYFHELKYKWAERSFQVFSCIMIQMITGCGLLVLGVAELNNG
jgi:ABC-type multidrug transport system permease subunit